MTDWHPFCWGEHRPLGETCATCPWETSCIDKMGSHDRLTEVFARVAFGGEKTIEAVRAVYSDQHAPAAEPLCECGHLEKDHARIHGVCCKPGCRCRGYRSARPLSCTCGHPRSVHGYGMPEPCLKCVCPGFRPAPAPTCPGCGGPMQHRVDGPDRDGGTVHWWCGKCQAWNWPAGSDMDDDCPVCKPAPQPVPAPTQGIYQGQPPRCPECVSTNVVQHNDRWLCGSCGWKEQPRGGG